MKYLIVVTKKQIDAPVMNQEFEGTIGQARDLAFKLTDDNSNEEVVLKIHPLYHTKNMKSDVIERFSCGAKALNRLFGC